MKSPYVSDLEPNQTFTATFLVLSKEVRQKRSGEPYLSLLVGDRTGDLDAKMWDNAAEAVEIFARDDFIRVRGLLQVHQNRPQLTIHKLERVGEDEVDLADYFPASRREVPEMSAELALVIEGIGNLHLRALLEAVFQDPAIARLFRLAPAAKMIHHAFLGGLLEHVLSMSRLARMAADHYPYVDRDLLLAGVLLHDLGKIHELSYDRSFGYSDEGQLVGHIAIGLRILHEKLHGLPDFPPKLRALVEHLVLSHHGELEYGSPKVPLFPEAMLLHQLDNLDSKMEAMRSLIERDRQVEGCWTGYNPALDRAVLKKDRYLQSENRAPQPASALVDGQEREETPASRPGAATPPVKPGKPQTNSDFGSKLADALKR